MSVDNCGICNRDNVEELEQLGQEAMLEKRSWRNAAATAGLSHHAALKNHMMKHFQVPVPETEAALAELDPVIANTMRELTEAMEFAPLEVKPLYAVAIRNLRGLAETKPSQQNLITALKAIHEITGMKMEQKLMLGFAGKMFGLQPSQAKAAIDKGQEYIEAESEEVEL